MKKSILTVVAIVLTINTMLWAQTPRINVQHNGVASFYNDMASAVTGAASGDTIYIPGGVFDLGTSGLTINKTLHLIGVGHYPDSTVATGYTRFNGSIKYVDNADNGSLTGVYVTYTVYLGTSSANQEINNFSILRCNIPTIYLSYNGSSTTTSTNFMLKECVVLTLMGGNIQNSLFEKNIIQSQASYFTSGNYFKNNIFLIAGATPIDYISNSLFENNIILATTGINSVSTNTTNIFNNNLWVYGSQTFPSGSNIGSNNIIGQAQTTIFVNQTGTTFNYTHDYHLKATCLGKNAGTDGTDIGLYGTAQPYKECAVPFNPHIRTKTVSTQLDGTGKLHIDINVSAQDR